MPKYIAHSKTWLSHENRLVDAGQEFDTTFPEGMKLAGNIELVEDKTAPTRTRRPRVVKTGSDQGGDSDQTGSDTDNTGDDDQGQDDGSDADTGDLDDTSGD
ncbi:hypothetical protein [Methylomonas koyamae]|uniref:hypothetical protein n=1 Tax=Methylomonas koyamae TaxID=702114 RepID=UPI00112A1363|nr:hypothetical protein [Methylomonas koyamae]TPQ24933.1 hypothetical protein C2U68_17295 [Methylomonas koyamae]